jgi:hypothetical protein
MGDDPWREQAWARCNSRVQTRCKLNRKPGDGPRRRFGADRARIGSGERALVAGRAGRAAAASGDGNQ